MRGHFGVVFHAQSIDEVTLQIVSNGKWVQHVGYNLTRSFLSKARMKLLMLYFSLERLKINSDPTASTVSHELTQEDEPVS